MISNWKYPGSKWWRFDFHVHTPASIKCYKKLDATPEEWLKSCMDTGLDAVVVTDHNSGDWIDRLNSLYATINARDPKPNWFRSLVIYPGVEISLGAVHLLAVFDPTRDNEKTITAVLGQCGITNGHGDPDVLATKSFVEAVEIIQKANGFPIAAHIDQEKGLLHETTTLNLELKRDLDVLHAAEFCNLNAFDAAPPELQKAVACLAKVGGSDAHSPDEIGKHGTWVKMSRPSIEGLRLALMDQEFCIDNGTENPNREPDIFLKSLSITGMRHCGRIPGHPFQLSFHPGFNSIIGGRGTGKSTTLDAIRLAARRHEELSDFEALNADINQFMNHSTKKGVMENDTEIQLVFCRRSEQYRINWRFDKLGRVLECLDGDVWVNAEPGDLRERFPMALYSQKQLFELAENPGGLLEIIDRSPAVNRVEWERRWEATTNRFMELRLQQRRFRQELNNEAELRTKLGDIEKDLQLYEERGHGEVLKQYQKRIEQLRAMPIEDNFGNLAGSVLQLHESAQVDVFPFHLFPEDDSARLEVSMIHGTTANAMKSVQERLRILVDEIDTIAKQRTEALQASKWYASVLAATEAYSALIREYEAKNNQFDPSLYGHWVQEKASLQNELAKVDAKRRELSTVIEETNRILDNLFSLRTELSDRRKRFIDEVIGTSRYVRMELVPFGSVEGLEADYRNILALDDSSFKPSILGEESGLLRTLYLWQDEGIGVDELPGIIREVKVLSEGIATGNPYSNVPYINKPFVTRLQKGYETQPANLDKLWCWWPEDLLKVKHVKDQSKGKFEELERGSAGQKAASILAFLLSHGTEPLIIDQPEDDLDNALIYDLVVRQIRENKLRRQLIIVTHNPNIVVNGDAELVHVLHMTKGQIQTAVVGGLEEQTVRDHICEIMEGGREAFDKRYKRITLEV